MSNKNSQLVLVSLALAAAMTVAALITASPRQPAAAATHPVDSSLSTQAAQLVYLPQLLRSHNAAYPAPFGIAMFGAVDQASGLGAMRTAGATRVMTTLNWAEVQPVENGPYDWTNSDARFANATAAGMRVYVLFDQNPTWVSSQRRGPVPADKLPALKAVVQAMAQRYNGGNGGPRVDYWSFYGEPDAIDAWGQNGVAYAAMLKEVAPLVRVANPQATVLIGAPAYDRFTQDDGLGAPLGPHTRSFITDTLQSLNTNWGGAAQYIQAFAFDYYPVSPTRWPTLLEKTAEIRSILNNHGLSHLPLIVPEISMWSVWPAPVGEQQRVQAQYLVHHYIRGWSAGIQQLYWFQVFDIIDSQPDDFDEQGLFVGTDLNRPKLAYFAYQTLTREMAGAVYAGRLTYPDAEGYRFLLEGRVVTVVWGTSMTPAAVDFANSCVRVVDLLGTATLINDGGIGDQDFAANGQIRLLVPRLEPVYVRAC
jgi:hypothetical protein